MRQTLAGQVIVITGASSGIGRCTALHLAASGAKVVLTARRRRPLAELVNEIRGAGGQAISLPGDVTSEPHLRAVAAAAVQQFGSLDTWINNAGVYIQGRVQDLTLNEYRRILEVNFIGLVNGTQAALEVMLPAGRGTIIQVSSVAAKRGVPFTSAYSAAKSAIDGFTSSIRSELWGSGVRFGTLYPPTVDTPIYHQGRGRLGVVPKPAPPVADPEQAARAIARLVRRGNRHAYFGWSRSLAVLNALFPAGSDWLLHHAIGFTYSDIPSSGDNLHRPSRTVPATIRAGWRDEGWKGLTVKETVRVLPVESALAGAVAAVLLIRAGRAIGNRAHSARAAPEG